LQDTFSQLLILHKPECDPLTSEGNQTSQPVDDNRIFNSCIPDIPMDASLVTCETLVCSFGGDWGILFFTAGGGDDVGSSPAGLTEQ
jgi:hypothetical protein